jgi:transposase
MLVRIIFLIGFVLLGAYCQGFVPSFMLDGACAFNSSQKTITSTPRCQTEFTADEKTIYVYFVSLRTFGRPATFKWKMNGQTVSEIPYPEIQRGINEIELRPNTLDQFSVGRHEVEIISQRGAVFATVVFDVKVTTK